MINLNIEQLVFILICLLPGYVFEHVVRYRVPHKESTGLEYFLNLLWHSLVINSLLLVLLLLFEWNVIEKYVISVNRGMNNYYFFHFVFIYSSIVIILSYLIAVLFAYFINKYAKDNLPVFTRIINEISQGSPLFLKVVLKNDEIYSGQLIYYPDEYNILTSTKFHISLEEVYQFRNGNWEKLKNKGLLLNVSDIVSIEYNMGKIEDSSN